MSAIQNPSLSKNKIKVLLLEGISDSAAACFEKAGYENIERLATALDGDDLSAKLKDTRILGIRSRTQITKEVLNATDRLVAVGCFSVGTNQIDLTAAQRRGVPVFNAPFSNTRSVAELTVAEIVMLFRRTFLTSPQSLVKRPSKPNASRATCWFRNLLAAILSPFTATWAVIISRTPATLMAFSNLSTAAS